MSVINWIIENYIAMATGAVTILTGLAIFARFTPSQKDDAWIAKIIGWLNKLLAK